MLKCIALMVFLIAISLPAQQTAAKETKTSPTPALPRIDYNACPFECCTFQQWKVTKTSDLFDAWRKGGKPLGRVAGGQAVTGVTGVHITFKPDTLIALQDFPELHVKSGNTMLRYMYHGEGMWDMWAAGRWVPQDYQWSIAEKNEESCFSSCNAKVTEEGEKEWWVKIRTQAGLEGWVKVDSNFEGMDACA